MNQKISMNWVSSKTFETIIDGHKIVVDSSKESGGNDLGPRPKALMMVALGGCSGMDVVSILEKMRVEYDSLEIVVEGDLAEEHPKKFLTMKIIYNFTGKNLPLDKIQKAVSLSTEKYCGVYASYQDSIKMENVINLNTVS